MHSESKLHRRTEGSVLKELLGHGLATHNEHDRVFACFCWAPSTRGLRINLRSLRKRNNSLPLEPRNFDKENRTGPNNFGQGRIIYESLRVSTNPKAKDLREALQMAIRMLVLIASYCIPCSFCPDSVLGTLDTWLGDQSPKLAREITFLHCHIVSCRFRFDSFGF